MVHLAIAIKYNYILILLTKKTRKKRKQLFWFYHLSAIWFPLKTFFVKSIVSLGATIFLQERHQIKFCWRFFPFSWTSPIIIIIFINYCNSRKAYIQDNNDANLLIETNDKERSLLNEHCKKYGSSLIHREVDLSRGRFIAGSIHSGVDSSRRR
jgi:hypothetical protein